MNKLTTILMNDVERMRKFLARMEYFKMVLDVPGDIVELGGYERNRNGSIFKDSRDFYSRFK
jgi:hypothetical protein